MAENVRDSIFTALEYLPRIAEEAKRQNPPPPDGSQNKIKITLHIKLSKPPEIGLSVEW